jgi:hypothetical protein
MMEIPTLRSHPRQSLHRIGSRLDVPPPRDIIIKQIDGDGDLFSNSRTKP